MKSKVKLSKAAKKGLESAPPQCQRKFRFWTFSVETAGVVEAAKTGDFNDEVLKGKRKGQRSIRLNQGWRAIYTNRREADGSTVIELVEVQEVSNHDY